MTKSHEDHGKIVHRPYSSCISSVGNLTGTPSSSPCQLKPGGWLSHLGLSHYNCALYTQRSNATSLGRYLG